jgi:flagellar biosynthesis protein FlhF
MAANATELRAVLDGLSHKKLVLIDTAGMSQRDVRLATQFATLRTARHPVRAVLVLSAAAARGTLAETVEAFRGAEPKALAVTKVDETTSLGPVLSLAVMRRLPIAYLTDGQRVPEDLQVAGRKRLWLMQTAVRLARGDPGRPGEDELAERYGAREAAGHG